MKKLILMISLALLIASPAFSDPKLEEIEQACFDKADELKIPDVQLTEFIDECIAEKITADMGESETDERKSEN